MDQLRRKQATSAKAKYTRTTPHQYKKPERYQQNSLLVMVAWSPDNSW